jgi:hypothetical protein
MGRRTRLRLRARRSKQFGANSYRSARRTISPRRGTATPGRRKNMPDLNAARTSLHPGRCRDGGTTPADGWSRRPGSRGMLSGKQGVDAMTVENPNVKSIWTTIEVDKDGVETVLVVETDLELNAGNPAFDVAKVDALIDAAMKSFAASGGTIDRVHLVPVRMMPRGAKGVKRPAKTLPATARPPG